MVLSASMITFIPLEVLVVSAISSGSALMKAATFRSDLFALRQPLIPVNVAVVHHQA